MFFLLISGPAPGGFPPLLTGIRAPGRPWAFISGGHTPPFLLYTIPPRLSFSPRKKHPEKAKTRRRSAHGFFVGSSDFLPFGGRIRFCPNKNRRAPERDAPIKYRFFTYFTVSMTSVSMAGTSILLSPIITMAAMEPPLKKRTPSQAMFI